MAVAGPDGAWLAGVVHAPALGRVYYASRGHGAWLEENGRRTQLNGPVAGPDRPDPGHGLQLRPGRPGRAGQPGWAASWTASPTSAGWARRRWTSASWRTAPTTPTANAGLNEHDFAAGALIAEEAGCWVRRPRLTSVLDGGPSDDERLAAWTCAGPLELSGKFPL